MMRRNSVNNILRCNPYLSKTANDLDITDLLSI
jgi:hypothetical protein